MTKYKLEIKSGKDCDSPRAHDFNLGTIIAVNNHIRSDKSRYNPYWGMFDSWIQDFTAYIYSRTCYNAYPSRDELVSMDFMKKFVVNNYIYFPIYIFKHGNIKLDTKSFNRPYGTDIIGYVYVSKERIREQFRVKRISKNLIKKIEKRLKAELDVYARYLNDEYYCFTVRDETGKVSFISQEGYRTYEEAKIVARNAFVIVESIRFK